MKKLAVGIVLLIILVVFFECRRREQEKEEIRQEKLKLLDDMARRLDRIDSLRAKLNER